MKKQMFVSGYGPEDSSNFVTTDKLYLLATGEIWENEEGNSLEDDTARELTRQLDYYGNLGVTTSNYSGAIKDDSIWWLRSAESEVSSFYSVSDDGDWNSNGAPVTYGVAVAFRL